MPKVRLGTNQHPWGVNFHDAPGSFGVAPRQNEVLVDEEEIIRDMQDGYPEAALLPLCGRQQGGRVRAAWTMANGHHQEVEPPHAPTAAGDERIRTRNSLWARNAFSARKLRCR